MRDKVIAVLDVAWIGAALVYGFTRLPAALVASLVLAVIAVGLGWRDRKAPRSRSSWRYWTEPRPLDGVEPWSSSYWGALTAAFALLAVLGWGLAALDGDVSRGSFPLILAIITGWGWWKAEQADVDTTPTAPEDRA